jgi:hypothetical protein
MLQSIARPRIAATSLAIALAIALGPGARRARAWGDKGHEMSALVAAHSLPHDMPAFFRRADVELAALCPEPDHWRDGKTSPALKGLTDHDHTFRLEDATLPLPPDRFAFVAAELGKPRAEGGTQAIADLRFAPYAIAERAELLTVSFAQWRRAPERTPAEKRRKRQIEQNIIFIAGTLGHFVTDAAMPLHTSIHIDGWSPLLANPHGYRSNNVHAAFEQAYVDRAITERDFAPLVGPVRPLGPWLDAAVAHIQESHAQVERLLALDLANPFGGGHEPVEAKAFVSEALAHGAAALRDFWYAAWVKSAATSADTPP